MMWVKGVTCSRTRMYLCVPRHGRGLWLLPGSSGGLLGPARPLLEPSAVPGGLCPVRPLLSSALAPALTGGLDQHQLSTGCQICSLLPPDHSPP